MTSPMTKVKSWMFYTLMVAGIYNIVWGAWVILFPDLSLTIFGVKPVQPKEIWQCVGMIVGVYGVGYLAAAMDPIRHWPIVLVGFLGKVFGPIGFLKALADGVFPPAFAINIIFNDLIWWVPFFLILKASYRQYSIQQLAAIEIDYSSVMGSLRKLDLDWKKPVLLINLRHTGCTFTRECLDTVAKNLGKIREKKWQLVFVHMGKSDDFAKFASRFFSTDSYRQIADPSKQIYRNLGLRRGGLTKMFGLKEWLRGSVAMAKGYGIGWLQGDGFQLAGMFLFTQEKLNKEYRTTRASDRLPIEEWLEQDLGLRF